MNVPYDLWPIWCDSLEEQGQDTELLRYVFTYSIWNICIECHSIFTSNYIRTYYENSIGDGFGYAWGHSAGFSHYATDRRNVLGMGGLIEINRGRRLTFNGFEWSVEEGIEKYTTVISDEYGDGPANIL